MAAGKIKHWKHGWIPLDAYARDIQKQRGSDKSKAPNTSVGIPDLTPSGDHAGAVRRAQEIDQLVPGTKPDPHYQFASQSMRARYTGGVVFPPEKIDRLLTEISLREEGHTDLAADKRAAGLPVPAMMDIHSGDPSPEAQAKRRADRLRALLNGETAAAPHYELPPGAAAGSGKGFFTGGVYLRRDQTQDLIAALNKRFTGRTTLADTQRAAGVYRK